MPQWIELDFAAPTRLNTVYLTFDTNMNPRHTKVTAPFVPECVRDYELAVPEGDHWRVLVRETENFQRHRVHRFDPVVASRLRLTVHATNGARSARVFEIRVYDESPPASRKTSRCVPVRETPGRRAGIVGSFRDAGATGGPG